MPQTNEESHQIARKAGRGIVWNFMAYGAGKVVVLLTTSILARVLAKDDFGLVAVAVIVINYLSVVKDLGLGVALIQRRGDVDDASNTVFTINLIVGVFLSLIVVLIAPFVAVYFKDPMVTPVLRWLGCSFAINALGSVHIILLARELDYRRKFIPDLGNALIKGITSIGLAFAGFGVWALVFGQILGVVTSVILVWMVFPWRPRLMLNRVVASTLMKFGASVFGEDVLSIFIENFGYVVAGRLFGLTQLSIYTLAFRLPEMLLIGNLWVMAGVTFPAFSAIQNNPDAMRRGMLASIRFIQMLALPISLGLFLASDLIINVVFGEQWADAAPIMRILAVYAWVHSVGFHVGDVYKAVGRPDILLKLTLLYLALIVPFILLGSNFGLIGVAWGQLFATLVYQCVSLFVATKFVDISFSDILKELSPSLQGGAAMTLVVSIVLILSHRYSSYIQLALVVLAGVISYIGVLWLIEKNNLMRMLRVVGIGTAPKT